MSKLPVLLLGVYLFFTISSFGFLQQQSQETTNAVVGERIVQLETKQITTDIKLDHIYAEMANLKASVNQFVGVGIGFGALVSILHAMSVYASWRNGKQE